MGTFHNGSFRGAIRNGIPIVPVSIDGTYKIMEANNGKWIRPGHVILTFLPVIETAGMDKDRQKNLGDEIAAAILDARAASRKSSENDEDRIAETEENPSLPDSEAPESTFLPDSRAPEEKQAPVPDTFTE